MVAIDSLNILNFELEIYDVNTVYFLTLSYFYMIFLFNASISTLYDLTSISYHG